MVRTGRTSSNLGRKPDDPVRDPHQRATFAVRADRIRDHARECVVRTGRTSSNLGRKPDDPVRDPHQRATFAVRATASVTTHVSAWFGRDERPPTSGVSPTTPFATRTNVRRSRFAPTASVTTHVSAWFGRDERPPTSGVSPTTPFATRTNVRRQLFPVPVFAVNPMNTDALIEPVATAKRPSQSLKTLILPMRSEFRRCAVYVLIGAVVLAVIRWAIRDLLPTAASEPWSTLVPCSLPALAATAVLRWRLRVDSSGIARRRFMLWDLWPWQAFEQGKVLDAEGTSTTYILPEKPFWARKLTLDLLEDSDRARVEASIEALRVRPAPLLPHELALRYGFRKEILIAPGGLLFRGGGDETRYRWAEVQAIRIRRADHRRRDFKSLEIELPDRLVTFSVRLHQGQTIRSWQATRGGRTPSAEVLAAVLERFVARDRVQVDSLDKAPLTMDQWNARRAVLAKQKRELRMMRRMLWGGGALMLLVSLSDYHRGVFAVVGMAGLSVVAIGQFYLIVRYIERDQDEQIARLQAQMPEQ